MLSQDGKLRFIDIHACKQLFEIGGADEVHFYNDNLLLFLLPGRKIYFMILAELHNLIKNLLVICILMNIIWSMQHNNY